MTGTTPLNGGTIGEAAGGKRTHAATHTPPSAAGGGRKEDVEVAEDTEEEEAPAVLDDSEVSDDDDEADLWLVRRRNQNVAPPPQRGVIDLVSRHPKQYLVGDRFENPHMKGTVVAVEPRPGIVRVMPDHPYREESGDGGGGGGGGGGGAAVGQMGGKATTMSVVNVNGRKAKKKKKAGTVITAQVEDCLRLLGERPEDIVQAAFLGGERGGGGRERGGENGGRDHEAGNGRRRGRNARDRDNGDGGGGGGRSRAPATATEETLATFASRDPSKYTVGAPFENAHVSGVVKAIDVRGGTVSVSVSGGDNHRETALRMCRTQLDMINTVRKSIHASAARTAAAEAEAVEVAALAATSTIRKARRQGRRDR